MTAREIVDRWLERTAQRWEQAIENKVPDWDRLHDIPPIPGHLSYEDLLTELRSRVGLYQEENPLGDNYRPFGDRPGETLHTTLESWFAEATKRLDAGHNLIPSDDPASRVFGFHDTADEVSHGVPLTLVRERGICLDAAGVYTGAPPEELALFSRLRARRP